MRWFFVIALVYLHRVDADVAHFFLFPESYAQRITSCGTGIFPPSIPKSSTKLSLRMRPEKKNLAMKIISNHDKLSEITVTATTTTTTSVRDKSKRFSLSQFVNDLMANERGDEGEAGSPSSLFLSSKTINTDRKNDVKSSIQDSSASTNTKILIVGTVLVVVTAWALAVTLGNELGIDLEFEELLKDPSNSLENILKSLETMDAQKGMIYFSSFYILAEILAIPAVPILTASSGYLFGLLPGTATCLFSAVIAASISFVIGRTCLRGYVESVLADNPKFRAMDRAVDKGGFKLMFITRLSPLFPFALSNYLFGASSIQFPNYFFGTLLGFSPGTFAYVYAGSVGKALTIDSESSKPWYVYLGGMAVIIILLKIAGDVASSVIDSLEDDTGDCLEGDADRSWR